MGDGEPLARRHRLGAQGGRALDHPQLAQAATAVPRIVGPGPDTRTGALLAALHRLPAPERRCIVLHHMAGAPLLEIAAVEGVSVGTTAARLARAQQVVERRPRRPAIAGWLRTRRLPGRARRLVRAGLGRSPACATLADRRPRGGPAGDRCARPPVRRVPPPRRRAVRRGHAALAIDVVIGRAGTLNRASTAAAVAVLAVGALGGVTAVAHAGVRPVDRRGGRGDPAREHHHDHHDDDHHAARRSSRRRRSRPPRPPGPSRHGAPASSCRPRAPSGRRPAARAGRPAAVVDDHRRQPTTEGTPDPTTTTKPPKPPKTPKPDPSTDGSAHGSNGTRRGTSSGHPGAARPRPAAAVSR